MKSRRLRPSPSSSSSSSEFRASTRLTLGPSPLCRGSSLQRSMVILWTSAGFSLSPHQHQHQYQHQHQHQYQHQYQYQYQYQQQPHPPQRQKQPHPPPRSSWPQPKSQLHRRHEGNQKPKTLEHQSGLSRLR
ncbi:protein deltex-like isoform X4 [Cyclopterus lumpus]|uniref:protein deltex-like isoform X4 n=1 Tax=Cyclopterus lumpus TaxID=8103 RepID=UPI001485D792|nr:protein deltex-like isoform X4 [Cyclopterus lumpus]